MFFMLWLILFCKASGLGRGKRWAVAVARQRPTAARGNRGGVTIHVATLSGKTFTLDVALSDYGIQAAATPHLDLRRRGGMQIQVRRPLIEGRRLLVRGKTFTLDVAASDSVASVKAQIHSE